MKSFVKLLSVGILLTVSALIQCGAADTLVLKNGTSNPITVKVTYISPDFPLQHDEQESIGTDVAGITINGALYYPHFGYPHNSIKHCNG